MDSATDLVVELCIPYYGSGRDFSTDRQLFSFFNHILTFFILILISFALYTDILLSPIGVSVAGEAAQSSLKSA